jgi:hypothetical protein
MKKLLIPTLLLVLGSVVLGATVFRAPLASAAGGIPSMFVANDKKQPLPVEEQNLDADGNIKVHEQGTADVNVTNGSLRVAPRPDPVTGGAVTLGIGCPSSSTQPETIVASALQIAWIGAGATTVRLLRGDSVAARFVGPGVSGDSSSFVLPLTRPIAFTTIECTGAGGVIVSTVGNEP